MDNHHEQHFYKDTETFLRGLFLSFFLFFFFLLFLFIYFLAVLRGIWDLSPQAGIEPVSPALEVKSLNCWTTRSSKGLFLMLIAENNRGAEGSPMRK